MQSLQALRSSVATTLFQGPAAPLSPGDPRLLFGQFVGDWEFDVTDILPDGTKRNRRGEWHFAWILGGRGVQDVWMVPGPQDHDQGAPWTGYGTTVRVYDASLGAWKITWHGVMDATVLNFVARQRGAEIVLEEIDDEPEMTRWIFSDITPGSFKWRAVISRDRGATWIENQVMYVRRKP
jgi:hypothetical protein